MLIKKVRYSWYRKAVRNRADSAKEWLKNTRKPPEAEKISIYQYIPMINYEHKFFPKFGCSNSFVRNGSTANTQNFSL